MGSFHGADILILISNWRVSIRSKSMPIIDTLEEFVIVANDYSSM